MGKLTDIKIKSLKPRDKSFLYREDAPRGEGGFAIRVLPSGVKTWQIIYSFEGKRRWLSLGQYPNMGLADARKKFKQAKQLLEQGKNPGDDGEAKAAAARGAITVNDLCDKFLEEYASKEKRPNSTKEDRLNLKRDVRKKIGSRKAAGIVRRDIQEIINSIESRGAKVQAQRTLSSIRKMFNWAVDEEILKENPALTVRAPKTKSQKIRELSFDEIKIIWISIDSNKFLPKAVGIILKLILLTGCRPSEAISIYQKVHRGKQSSNWIMLTSDETKNKKAHRIYISSLAQKVLADSREDTTLSADPKFTIKNYTLSAWVRNQNYLGLTESWTPHDLRRSCATRLAEIKTPPHLIPKILNHTDKGITDAVYNLFIYADEIAEALENLGNEIDNHISALNKNPE